MRTDRSGNTCREKCAKRNGEAAKIPDFMYRDTTNVRSEM